MRPLATLAAALALPLAAPAQAPTATATVSAPTLGGGQVVGALKQQPRPFAQVAPQVGGGGPAAPATPFENPANKLPGMNIDPSNVVGPLPEGFVPAAEKSGWEKFLDRYGVTLGLIDPPKPPSNWTPGLARRNRERTAERVQMWWRD